MKTKEFVVTLEHPIDEEINSFLDKNNVEVLDIKYCRDMICTSALLVYEEIKKYERGPITKVKEEDSIINCPFCGADITHTPIGTPCPFCKGAYI